jgi:acylphosphatase
VKRLDIRVIGRVQGVFFRASTQEAARRLGIQGTVRNEPDGSVFIEAEGPAEALEVFVAWCRRGPPGARVVDLEIREGEPANLSGFEITR